jgi:hypothetical protein
MANPSHEGIYLGFALDSLYPAEGEGVVNFQFNPEEWANMTPQQQINRCTILAEEAQKLAEQADEKFEPLYRDLTLKWLTLATELSRSASLSSSSAAVSCKQTANVTSAPPCVNR